MKMAIQLTLVAFILNAQALAGHYGSSLELIIREAGIYTVDIDGQRFVSSHGAVYIDHIAPGNYALMIYKLERVGNERFVVKQDVLVHSGRILIPHDGHVVGDFDRYGMRIRRGRLDPPRRRAVGHHHAAGHSGKPKGMHPADYDRLIAGLCATSFDRTKLSMAIAALDHNAVTTAQAAGIMRSFSFDSYRMEVAKMASRRVEDPYNLYLLANEFTFESNARKFLHMIR